MKYNEFLKKFKILISAEISDDSELKSLSVVGDKYDGSYFKLEIDEEGDYTLIVDRNIKK